MGYDPQQAGCVCDVDQPAHLRSKASGRLWPPGAKNMGSDLRGRITADGFSHRRPLPLATATPTPMLFEPYRQRVVWARLVRQYKPNSNSIRLAL